MSYKRKIINLDNYSKNNFINDSLRNNITNNITQGVIFQNLPKIYSTNISFTALINSNVITWGVILDMVAIQVIFCIY